MSQLPENARVVIVGGGVIGCSVAYHLAKQGWQDVVLLERKQLTSGTTWHAAGLIAQLRSNKNMTRLAKYSQELYFGLEAETGVATGFKRVGSITAALTGERHEELLRTASMARAFGVEVEDIGPNEIKSRYEHLNIEDVVGGVYLPKDGQGDPANIALPLAGRARGPMARRFWNASRSRALTRTGAGSRACTGNRAARQGRSGRSTSSTAQACGATLWGGWRASTCPFMPASTSTS